MLNVFIPILLLLGWVVLEEVIIPKIAKNTIKLSYRFKWIGTPIIIGLFFGAIAISALYAMINPHLSMSTILWITGINLIAIWILISYLSWQAKIPSTNDQPQDNLAQSSTVNPQLTLFHQNNLDQPTKQIKK